MRDHDLGVARQEAFAWSRRGIALAAGAILLVLGAISLAAGAALDGEDLTRLVERLRYLGTRWWAPLALIAAFTIINLVGIPGTPLTLAAGAVWGWLTGGALVMAAIMIGTSIPYLLTRRGVPRLRHTLEKRFGTLSRRLRGHGFTNVTLLRALHIFPFAAISYAAGLAGVRWRDYLLGTFLGTLPGVFIYTYLADSILAGAISREQAATRITIAAVALCTFIVASKLVAKRVRRRAALAIESSEPS